MQNTRAKKLKKIYQEIISTYQTIALDKEVYERANERLAYWYLKPQFLDILKLKISIDQETQNHPQKYHDFFSCALSNILKPCSKWLTKSIKPQVDPNKKSADVDSSFKKQFEKMLKAYLEKPLNSDAKINIRTGNFLEINKKSNSVDMIITSPPYVTSYEYADLHQLSSLWLEYVDDYRKLRNGSIGSSQIEYNFGCEIKKLNTIGTKVVFQLINRDKAQARAVAKYYSDMEHVAQKCHKILSSKSIALFVIGNTEYKGVRIENAQHLTKALYDAGFSKVSVSKRAITNKILTPYRDENGRFSSNKSARKIYSEEFIVVGVKE